eukprot:SAG31_NODE_3884_length_3784_cov_2.194030_7_plen_114_part_00
MRGLPERWDELAVLLLHVLLLLGGCAETRVAAADRIRRGGTRTVQSLPTYPGTAAIDRMHATYDICEYGSTIARVRTKFSTLHILHRIWHMLRCMYQVPTRTRVLILGYDGMS